MRRWCDLSRGVIARLSLLLAAAPLSAQSAPPLSAHDFVVAGLSHEVDSSAVRHRLGAPRRVSVQQATYDVGATWTDWYYRSIRIQFVAPNGIAGFWLLSPRIRTAREIGLGMTRAQVRTAYGPPGQDNKASGEDAWVYFDPETELHLIKIWFVRDTVDKIYLGYASD